MKTIYLFKSARDSTVELKGLTTYFEQQEVVVKDINELDQPNKADYILLIEPYRKHGSDYAISAIWNTWLLQKSPYTHLLVAAFSTSRHSNFLNLADMPADLNTWLENTKPAIHFLPDVLVDENEDGQKVDTIIDPWIRNIPLTGQSLREKFTLFVKGHDYQNSFKMALIDLNKSLRAIKTLYQEENGAPAPEALKSKRQMVKHEWDKLFNRWNQYHQLLSLLPTSLLFQADDHTLEQSMQQKMSALSTIIKPSNPPLESIERGLEIVTHLGLVVKNELEQYIEH